MGALDELVSAAAVRAAGLPVDDVVVGVHYTAVRGRSVGLAATQPSVRCCDAPPGSEHGRLHERSVTELLALTRSPDPLEVSVGMAALNSVVAPRADRFSEVDAVDLILARGRDRTVVTVGHFPATPALRRAARRLHVLEQNPRPGDEPADAAADLLPRADVIGLTATTLLNGTFDDLARLFPPRALVVLLGPSTPLTPLLFDHGVDVLAGSVVTDADTLMRCVAQGASRRQLRGLRRATLVRDAAGRTGTATA